MTDSRPSTTALSADDFLSQSRLAQRLGFSHQLIEDKEFRGDRVTIRGRELCNFGLCSYLALGDDPRVVEGAADALRRYGNTFSSSIAYAALPLYQELTDRLEAMLEASVAVAGTTTLAHLAALPILVGSEDLVLVDGLVHASIQLVLPSLQMAGAEVRRMPHSDLEKVAATAGDTSRRVWYLIDGVYSMHGDTAPAERLRDLLEAHSNLWIYCDDAHGFGWAGSKGRGQHLERAGWHERLVMSFGLSKSFGAAGGVVAALDHELIEQVKMLGGPMVFGGPLSPASLGAGVASADIHLSEELPLLQRDLSERIDFVNSRAREIGLPLTSFERTPLWFVEVGPQMTTGSVAGRVQRDGFFVNIAVHPVVQRRRSGIRFTVTRYNTMHQIEALLDSINAAMARYRDAGDVLDLSLFED